MVYSPDVRLAVIVLAPLFGAALSYGGGRISARLAGILASLAVAFAFVTSCSLCSELRVGAAFTWSLGSWISFGNLNVPLALVFDQLSAVMCLIITGIGALIHVYSIGYMQHDAGKVRYFAYLNLFVASMLILVLGESLPVAFIGWEGVGLCSYLLIGFWYSNLDYARAGRKAFVMNRIGDLGFMLAMFVLYKYCGTLSIHELNTPAMLAKLGGGIGVIAGLALFVAATGKSAQIPLFTWLPDAMAGPTPVSALIHAATMVTGGVYLMARMQGVVEVDAAVPVVILVTALATALIAGSIALAQNDIKKVLAYSTVSQLGFMFIAVGVGSYTVAIFHVVTHAFFKACLFLSAGSVIHGCHHEQDMRKMGGLMRTMPLTCLAYGASTFAIAGIWPFAGFFSKHAIVDAVALTTNPHLIEHISCIGWLVKGLAVMTAVYMARSFVMTFLGAFRGEHAAHESPMIMLAPVLALAALSVGGGLILNGVLLEYLGSAVVSPHASHESLSLGGIVVGSLPGVIGFAIAWFLFVAAVPLKDSLRKVLFPLEWLFSGKFFVDELYEIFVVAPVALVSKITARTLDQSFIDGGVTAVGQITRASGELVRRTATGQVATYVLFMFCAAAMLIGLFIGH